MQPGMHQWSVCDQFKVDCLYCERDEQADVCLQHCGLSHITNFQLERFSIVVADLIEHWYRINSLFGRLSHEGYLRFGVQSATFHRLLDDRAYGMYTTYYVKSP